MRYPHITDINLSQYSFNNAKPNSPNLIPKPHNFASNTSIISTTPNSPNLSPKPHNSACNTSIISTTPRHACPNPSNLLALSHGDLATNANDQESNAEMFSHNEQPLGSSRWNPTPEQLLALEELYRRGTRTPSAAQIQQIATRLRRFGKIEGKNVFYWFQNHKARERQKRRRELETHEQPPLQSDTESLEKKESGTVTTGCKIEQTKKKGHPPSNIIKLSEEMQIQEKELQQGKITVGRSVSMWQAMELSSSPIYLRNSMTPTSLETRSRILNTQNLCSFKPHQENITTLEDENREDQTLELFPLGSNDRNNDINSISKKDTRVPIRAINTTTPNQYFEFLPLKSRRRSW
ncbi:hypothetical protein REPUB_Repub01dG0061200 [Reevesia pubescens]